MKKLIPIAMISMFALGACQTTTITKDGTPSAADTKVEPSTVDCVPTPENPQCGEGGGPGPILGDN